MMKNLVFVSEISSNYFVAGNRTSVNSIGEPEVSDGGEEESVI